MENALQIALDALQSVLDVGRGTSGRLILGAQDERRVQEALDALKQQQPVFWYRPRSDGIGYEGPIHNESIERVRKLSGGWVPLFAGAKPKPEQNTLRNVPPGTFGEAIAYDNTAT